MANTYPSKIKFKYSNPMMTEGYQLYQTYAPWHDVDDADNILFASVQGYGPKAPHHPAYVYPGSGATGARRV